MISTDPLASNRRFDVGPGIALRETGADRTPEAFGKLCDLVGTHDRRAEIADVMRWTDQLLEQLHKRHTLSPPEIHGDISPDTLEVDNNFDLYIPASTSGSEQSVNYRPLEQIWKGLDPISQRVILDRYDPETEKWLTQPLSTASDVYSVGATVYALTTGLTPPDALDRSIAEIEGKPDPLRPPAEVDPRIPVEISDVIVKAMSLNREQRYYSAVILRQVFRTATVRIKEREARPESVATVLETKPAESRSVVSTPASSAEFDRVKARQLAERILAERATTRLAGSDEFPITPEAPISDVAVAVAIEAETPPAVTELSESAPAFVTAETNRSNGRIVAFAVVALVAIGAAGTGVYQFTSTPRQDTHPVISPEAQLAPEPAPSVPTTPTPDSSAGDPIAAEPPAHALASEPRPDKRARPGAGPAEDKVKRTSTPSAKPAPSKKALTVDDLIND